jgi:hypothetical protein
MISHTMIVRSTIAHNMIPDTLAGVFRPNFILPLMVFTGMGACAT